jgi:hypothetical protein
VVAVLATSGARHGLALDLVQRAQGTGYRAAAPLAVDLGAVAALQHAVLLAMRLHVRDESRFESRIVVV